MSPLARLMAHALLTIVTEESWILDQSPEKKMRIKKYSDARGGDLGLLPVRLREQEKRDSGTRDL